MYIYNIDKPKFRFGTCGISPCGGTITVACVMVQISNKSPQKVVRFSLIFTDFNLYNAEPKFVKSVFERIVLDFCTKALGAE